LLIICGIGTLMLKQWARILTILTGLGIMLHALGVGGYYVAVVIPNQPKLMKDWFDYFKKIEEEERKKQQAQNKGKPAAPPPQAFPATPPASDASNHVLYLGMLIACVAYGAGMIVVMLLPGTRAAFAATPTPDEPMPSERDRLERRRRLLEDDDFDRPRRRHGDFEN
jgi:hypothetical protein